MALMKKPKTLNINFNFSDDSDDDRNNSGSNVQTKSVLTELNSERKHIWNELEADKTVVAGDHFGRCELAPLSDELGSPITESTCLYETDPTMYLTALEDTLSQSKPYRKTKQNKNCHAERDINSYRQYKSGIESKTKDNSELDKENVSLGNVTTKIRTQPSKAPIKPATFHYKADLDKNGIQATPLKGNKLSTKHRLFGTDKCSTAVSVDNDETNIPSLREKLLAVHTQLETSFTDSVDKMPSHNHPEPLSESFVEVQDISIQTSLIVESQEAKQDSGYKDQNIILKSENVIDFYSPVVKPPKQSDINKGYDRCSNLNVSQTIADVAECDTLPLELSSYEVQDRSIQTSLVETFVSNCEPFLIEKTFSALSLADKHKKGQSLQILEKLLVAKHIQNNHAKNDIREKECSGKTDIYSSTDVSAEEHYETTCESIAKKCNVDIIAPLLHDGKVNKEKSKLITQQDSIITMLDKESEECQIGISEEQEFKFDLMKQNMAICPDGKFNCGDKHTNETQMNCFGLEATDQDLSSNLFDNEESCDILVIASDDDDEDVDKLSDRHGDSVIAKVDESCLDEDDDVYPYDRGGTQENSKHEESTEAYDSDIEQNTTAAARQEYKAKIIPSNSTTDKEGITKGTDKETTNSHDHKEVMGANNFTKGQKLVNFDSMQRRQDPESSEGDSDFENFLNKVKNTSKPQRQTPEAIPLSEFIVDEEDSSEDEDNEMFHIRTNSELNQLKKESPSRYQKRMYTHYRSDNSCSETTDSDSDLDNFIVDNLVRKTRISAKPLVHMPDYSSDDDFLQDTNPTNKENSKTFSGLQVAKVDSETSCGSDVEFKPVKSRAPKTLGKSTNISSGKTSWGDSDVLRSQEPQKTALNTPRNVEQWKRPFETPAMLHVKKDDFKTPSSKKGKISSTRYNCPRSSFVCSSLSDDAFFLKSLSSDIADYKRHADAARFVKRFKDTKTELVQRLFKIFNDTVFEDKLPKDLLIEWSPRYTATAGMFYYKGTSNNFVSKVTLSGKICDSPERVRDTLAHELCHAAVQLINGVNESHGRFWKSWARKTNITFPFMPVIARCHNYVITTKYTYQCVNCKYRIGRHSKSLDTDAKVCGHCLGNFELFMTKELNSSNESCKTPATPRTPNKFALFVKDCYSVVKKREDGLRHGDIMKILSREFADKNKICD